jgi:hypothetical protein
VAASLMLVAAAFEAVHGVNAEKQSLEKLAIPLSANESDALQSLRGRVLRHGTQLKR